MKGAALLLLAGCSQIFGLSPPHRAADAAIDTTASDAADAHIDIPDAAPGHCVTQADCPTSVCLTTTVCAADTDVAWLSATGAALAPCTMQQPCSRMNDALATNKPYIRVIGTITNLASINQNVTIFGEPGAGFSGNVLVNGGTVGLYTLDFTAGNTCIQNQGATLTVEHCLVHDCNGYGISTNGALTLDGSTITHCRSGGVIVQGPTFVITNNFITQNGVAMQQTGGLTIQSTLGGGGGSRIDFNTVVLNNIKSTSNAAGGIYCNISGFTAVGNVVVHNTVNGSTGIAYANTNGLCAYSDSVIQASDSLGFVSTGANNYHITAQSPLRDRPMVTTTLATDVDGESRPYGAGYDLGADEYHP